jgi:protein tyrosine phosphatase (PTP) superfamily phosphohydrolase (DUF442 family)
MNKLLLTLITCLLSAMLCMAVPPRAEKVTVPGADLENIYRIDSLLYRSEQPDADDFIALEDYGIREVLNLRNYHNDNDEAEDTNLKLHRIATRAGKITVDELTDALRIIKNSKGPILVHCWHGSDRTGAVVAMYRIVFQGVSKRDAIVEMTNGGFGFHAMFDNIIDTIRGADIEAIKNDLNIK